MAERAVAITWWSYYVMVMTGGATIVTGMIAPQSSGYMSVFLGFYVVWLLSAIVFLCDNVERSTAFILRCFPYVLCTGGTLWIFSAGFHMEPDKLFIYIPICTDIGIFFGIIAEYTWTNYIKGSIQRLPASWATATGSLSEAWRRFRRYMARRIDPGDEVRLPLRENERLLTFSRAHHLTTTTHPPVLRRIGDKDVLPHVHTLLAFLSKFASIKHVAHHIDDAPWTEIVLFLNTLLKSERPEQLMPGPVFPTEQADNPPLPEDYLMRGEIWSQWYFPENWFAREHEEEDRYLELASTIMSRAERVLHLGYHLATFDRWISYDTDTHTFSATVIHIRQSSQET